MDVVQIAEKARRAALEMAALGGDAKNRALNAISRALQDHRDEIIAANRIDLSAADKAGLAPPLLKRLRFDAAKIREAGNGLDSLAALPDPAGVTLRAMELDKGLELYKVSRPIGVIGVIFESRPDALVQISCLCLKSGNAVLLKGGSEALHTNSVLADIIGQAAAAAGLPPDWMTLLTTRDQVSDMLALDRYIDLIIPRGSNAFVRHIMDNTNIAVLGHADGICHVYVDKLADPDMAVRVAVDSKCQYVAVCNAAETILVHEEAAAAVLPPLKAALEARGVEIRGCDATRAVIEVKPAVEQDWSTEYLDLIVSVKVVPSLAEAVAHINRYGSKHTDVIVSGDRSRALYFMDHIDSADVFWNCSSRFSDGFRYGLGAEVGIGTGKIHARGPVGLEGLVIYQWRLLGDGHVVSDYSGPQARPFTHRMLNKTFHL